MSGPNYVPEPGDTPEEAEAARKAWEQAHSGPDYSAVGDAGASLVAGIAAETPPGEAISAVYHTGGALLNLGEAAYDHFIGGDDTAAEKELTAAEMHGVDLIPGSGLLAAAWDLNATVLRAGGESATSAPTSEEVLEGELAPRLHEMNTQMLDSGAGDYPTPGGAEAIGYDASQYDGEAMG
jgi:hypothetical protein